MSDIDITGDVGQGGARSPRQLIGAQKKQVNQMRQPSAGGARMGVNTAQPAPQPESAAPEPATEPAKPASDGQGQGQPAGNPLQDLQARLQQGNQASQGPNQNLNPFNPIDWAKALQNDAWMTYHTGRRVSAVFGAFLDPNAVSSSIHNIWEQDTAQAQAAKLLLSGGGSAIPGLDQQKMATSVADAAGTILPMAANPLNVAMPEGRGAQAAVMIGAPAIQGVLSANPDEQMSGLAWAALTGAILGVGHLPAGMREPLAKAFSNWPAVETLVRGIVGARKTSNRNVVDPTYNHLEDWISQTLKQGEFGGAVGKTPVAKVASAADDAKVVTLPGGDISVRTGQLGRQRDAVLRRLGLTSVDDLVAKAQDTGFSGKEAKLIAENWSSLGLPYDLKRVTPAGDPLRDPRMPLRELHNAGDEGGSLLANQYLASVHHYLDQIHRGPFASAGDALSSTWRSLIGLNRNDHLVDQAHSSAAAKMLAYRGVSGEAVSRAIEGDVAAYGALPPEGRIVVDGFRLIGNALRHQSQGTDYAKNFVGNWLPHIDRVQRRGGPGNAPAATALTKEGRKHRVTAIGADEQGNLISTQQFPTVGAANAALQLSRERIVKSLTDPLAKLPKDLAGVEQAKWVQELAARDPEAAMAEATKLAAQLRPEKETDFQKVLGSGVIARQMKAIHSHQAMQIWGSTLLDSADTQGAKLRAAIKPEDARHAGLLQQQGYRSVNSPYMGGFLFHNKLADLLDRATTGRSALREGGITKAALNLESQAIARIMYMPPIHGMNMLGRAGVLWMQHPIALTKYLLDGKALLPHMEDEASFGLRSEAYNAGVLPHQKNMNYAQSLQGAYGNAIGDTLEPTEAEIAKDAQGPQALQKISQARESLNNYFWGAVNDFGVMAYHLEKASALHDGMLPADAAMWAARRANTWMGHVAPEDTNPIFHDLARAIAFAPNWWRTWGELMLPIYRRAGIDYGNPALVAHIVKEQTKMLASMLVFQKVTGNAMNLLLSGHLQNQNLPGNADRVEVTAPWVDRLAQDPALLGIGGLAGVLGGEVLRQTPTEDPKTGARRSVENPLGRFERDLEMVAGLQSGQRDWQLSDVTEGMARFLVSRLSPLIGATGALANFDVYHAVTSGMQNTQVDQHGWSPWNIAYAALMMTPLGLNLPQAIVRAQSQDPSLQQEDMPFGTKASKGMADALGTLPGGAEKVVLSWLTGVNPPYASAEKTRGTPPSDQQLARYREARDTYQQQMAALSARALGGETTPAQWLQQYRSIHSNYATIANATFRDAKQYVNGAEGMMNDYQSLYDEATDPATGGVDYAKLDQLQTQFRQSGKYNPSELQAMDEALHANDQKFPMLALYHKTIDAHLKWQEDWAARNGFDVGTIRAESAAYSALYNDPHASRAYLGQHRELAQYESAKRREWDRSPAGILWAFYYGNHNVIAQYMGSHHLQGEAQAGLAAEQAVEGAA